MIPRFSNFLWLSGCRAAPQGDHDDGGDDGASFEEGGFQEVDEGEEER